MTCDRSRYIANVTEDALISCADPTTCFNTHASLTAKTVTIQCGSKDACKHSQFLTHSSGCTNILCSGFLSCWYATFVTQGWCAGLTCTYGAGALPCANSLFDMSLVWTASLTVPPGSGEALQNVTVIAPIGGNFTADIGTTIELLNLVAIGHTL